MTTTSNHIKGAVAEAVFGDLATAITEDFAAGSSPILRGAAVEVHVISALQRQIRIKTIDHGTHYFNLRVSEQM